MTGHHLISEFQPKTASEPFHIFVIVFFLLPGKYDGADGQWCSDKGPAVQDWVTPEKSIGH